MHQPVPGTTFRTGSSMTIMHITRNNEKSASRLAPTQKLLALPSPISPLKAAGAVARFWKVWTE